MPNTLTSVFVSNPATEPVEAPHPNTGVYVLGTQATVGGPWTVTHTLVTKTTTPLTMVGRLKNYPTVTVSVVASGGPNNNGNIFNNVLATPTGTGAAPVASTPTTALNVAVSSILSNSNGYRLLASDTIAGIYVQIYQGTTAGYQHTGLIAGQVKYYKWQYVGNGQFYDDSLLSTAFSGTTSVGYQLAMLTDSRGAYPGDTGTNLTTSVWALAQARLTSGSTYTGTIVHHGYPGATPANLIDPAYTNSNTYVTAKTAGQSAVQYLISQLDPTKTPIIVVSAGANGGTAADIKAIHDALRAAVPGAITIVDPVLNRLDPTYASGIPNRAATNASLAAGVGVYAQDAVQSFNTPQVYADDAPNNGTYFWSPDTISGLSKVHLTTVGNQLQGESYAQAYARRLGLTLAPLVGATGAGVSQTYTQTSALLHYYSDTNDWANFSPNAQYITGYGGVSASAVASFGFSIACYGWRIVGPTSNLFGGILAKEAGVTVATGTQFANVAPASATGPVVQITKYYGTTLATHTVDFYKDPASPGQYLQANGLQFCDINGVFPAIPAAGAAVAAGTVIPVSFTAVGGATLVSTKLTGTGTTWSNAGGYDTHLFSVPAATGYLEIDLGAVNLPAATQAAILGGITVSGQENVGTTRYLHQSRAVYADKTGGGQLFINGVGGPQFTYSPGVHILLRIYATRSDVVIGGTVVATNPTANTSAFVIDVALRDADSFVQGVTYAQF